jgi:hypothetical protein
MPNGSEAINTDLYGLCGNLINHDLAFIDGISNTA